MPAPRAARALLLACTSFFWFAHYTYVPILAPYAEHRGASFELIGLIVSAYGLAQLVLRLPLGVFADRLGRRKPFVAIGLLTAAVAGAGLALSPSPEAMAGVRFVSGISACAWVTFTVLYASYYPEGDTTRAMGHLAFCNGVSIMVASFVGGWLAEHLGWTAPFWAAGGFGLVGFAVSLLLREARPDTTQPQDRVPLSQTLGHRPLIWASIVAALGMYNVFASSFGFLPNYAVSIGATKTQLGLLSTITLLFSSTSGLLSARTSAWLGPRVAIGASYLLITGATLAIPHVSDVHYLYVLQSLTGLGRGTAYPILMGLAIHGLPPRAKATAMGFFQAVYSLGMFLGPVISGQIGGLMGYTGLFTSTACVALLAALTSWKLPARQR